MPLFICVLLVPEAHCDLQASQLQCSPIWVPLGGGRTWGWDSGIPSALVGGGLSDGLEGPEEEAGGCPAVRG